MRRLFLLLAFAFTMLPLGAAQAACGDRTGDRGVALLIGVSEYRVSAGAPADNRWPVLRNAVRDVEHVCEALSKAGFATFISRDPDFEAFDQTLFDFGKAAKDADAAIIYFAGHGFQFRDQSFVVPATAPRLSTTSDLRANFIPVTRLTNAVSLAGQHGLLILDACRTLDPVLEVTDVAGGARGETGQVGQFDVLNGGVLYSTVKGRAAYDEAPVGSELSPFASAVLEEMAVPNEMAAFMKNVTQSLFRRTQAMRPSGPQYATYTLVPLRDFYIVEPQEPVVVPLAAGTRLELPSIERLAVEDEPRLMNEILKRHSLGELIAAGDAGDPVAQYLVGYAYEFGVGIRPDADKARRWLELSAAQDHPGGLLELGYFLKRQARIDGSLTEDQRDTLNRRARDLYERAAGRKYAKAQSHLASALLEDAQTAPPEDRAALESRALDLFTQAAAAGHVSANLSLAYYWPDQRPASEARLRGLAAAGNPEGSVFLCDLYSLLGTAGAVADQCLLAAEHGYGVARAILAGLYARGDGVTQSDADAVYWAKFALSDPDLGERPDLLGPTQKLAD